MKKLLLLCVAVLATSLFTACGGGAAKTPSDLAVQMVGYIQDGDYAAYVEKLGSKKGEAMSAEDKAEFAQMLESKGGQLQTQKKGITSCEAIKETISEDGKSATVKVKIVYGDGEADEENMKFVKAESGEWLATLK